MNEIGVLKNILHKNNLSIYFNRAKINLFD